MIDKHRFDWMKNPLNENVLILLRGLPSTGKSTLAKKLAGDNPSIICSADHFFEDELGNYTFDPLLLTKAHRICESKARYLMQTRQKLVIVDNVHGRIRDLMVYFSMAVDYDYRVEIMEPESPIWVNEIAPYLLEKHKNDDKLQAALLKLEEISKKTHNVSLKALQTLLRRFLPMVMFSDLEKLYIQFISDENRLKLEKSHGQLDTETD